MRVEQIGDATLYCGDALEIIPALREIDLVVTDPPYMVNTKSDGMGKLSPWADICNGALWFREWFGMTRRALKSDGAMWTFLNWRSVATYQKASCDLGWPIESMLVWDKEWIGPGGDRGLRPSYELSALFPREDFHIPNRGLPDIQRAKWSAIKPNGHPAEKPETLMRWLILECSQEDAFVADWFMGSGTTGAAAISTGRRFIGIEQDERWFNIACRRIEAAQRQTDMFVQQAPRAEQQAMPL